jgi:hypothetical protein
MRMIGCDLHARQQMLAMLDTITGEVVNLTLKHEGNNVREFYSRKERVPGIERCTSSSRLVTPPRSEPYAVVPLVRFWCSEASCHSSG